MAKKTLRNQHLWNFVTNDKNEVVAHGEFPEVRAGGRQGLRDNKVLFDPEDPDFMRLQQGAPVTWHDGRDEPVIGVVPVPPPPPPTPTPAEQQRYRDLSVKAQALPRRALRYLEVAPLQSQVADILDWVRTRQPAPAADTPMAILLAKLDAVKAELPVITSQEATELEALKTKFPGIV